MPPPHTLRMGQGISVAQAANMMSLLSQLDVGCGTKWALDVYSSTRCGDVHYWRYTGPAHLHCSHMLSFGRDQLHAASFNDISALISLRANEHGPPPEGWLEDACSILKIKVCKHVLLTIKILKYSLVYKLSLPVLNRKCLQPSGGLGLRMYAMLLTSLDRLGYQPSATVMEALVLTGRRLIRVSSGNARRQTVTGTTTHGCHDISPSGGQTGHCASADSLEHV